MIQCFKYLSSLNLVNLANSIVENNLLPLRDSNTESVFYQLFKWKSFKDGFREAKSIKRPVFLLIHKAQCPSCEKLKEKFSKSMRLMDLSDRFVMINVEMNDHAFLNEFKYQPDGRYVPRILFYTYDGNLIEEAYNKHKDADKEHKYFYSSPMQLVDTMLYVLREYTNDPLPAMFDQDRPLKPEDCDVDNDIILPTLVH